MKAIKSTGKPFPKTANRTIPAGEKVSEMKMKGKLMTVKERLNLQRRITHYENTKTNPPI